MESKSSHLISDTCIICHLPEQANDKLRRVTATGLQTIIKYSQLFNVIDLKETCNKTQMTNIWMKRIKRCKYTPVVRRLLVTKSGRRSTLEVQQMLKTSLLPAKLGITLVPPRYLTGNNTARSVEIPVLMMSDIPIEMKLRYVKPYNIEKNC